MNNFDFIFLPRSIAVIGASRKEGSVGNDIAKNLVKGKYAGEVYLVNPNADTILGEKAYASLDDIPGEVELAIIVVPAKIVPNILEEMARKDVRAAVVISAGFAESGNTELEEQVKELAKKHSITIIGPNCLGVLNGHTGMNASFASTAARAGKVAFLSQSGALCTTVLDVAGKRNIGFSKFASLGNKALVDEVALLEYLAKDDQTEVIALYVEQLHDSERFMSAVKSLRKLEQPKPVIILKSGRTEAGAAASASHTGALAGSDEAYSALFDQAGAIRVDSVSELFDVVDIFVHNNLPNGNKLGIITNAGGPGVLATDVASQNGLALAKLQDETVEALRRVLPEAASTTNPIDVLGDARAERYRDALELLVQDEDVDMVSVILTPQSMTEVEETARVIVAVNKNSHTPIVVAFMGDVLVAEGVDILRRGGVSVVRYPEEASRSLALLSEFSQGQNIIQETKFSFLDVDSQRVLEYFQEAAAHGQYAFPEADALEVFRSYGFSTLRSIETHSSEEALQATKEIGGKVVLKIISEDILHKMDVGGVIVGVDEANVESSYDQLLHAVERAKPDANIRGVLVVEMAPNDGMEMIVGAKRDPNLGPVVLAGAGGIYVEVFHDVAFGVLPITREHAKEMIEKLASHELLRGARGQQRLDEKALIDAVGRVAKLMADFPEIEELDINPLLVLPEKRGVKIMDGRIVLRKE